MGCLANSFVRTFHSTPVMASMSLTSSGNSPISSSSTKHCRTPLPLIQWCAIPVCRLCVCLVVLLQLICSFVCLLPGLLFPPRNDFLFESSFAWGKKKRQPATDRWEKKDKMQSLQHIQHERIPRSESNNQPFFPPPAIDAPICLPCHT